MSDFIPKTAILWASFGPYHFARLEAATKSFGHDRIVGIEISAETSTYAWRRSRSADFALHSLVENVPAESVSGWLVYRKLKALLRTLNIEVVFVPSYWPFSSFMAIVAAKHAGVRVVMMNDSHQRSGGNSLVGLLIKRQLIAQFDAALVAGSLHRTFFRGLGMANECIFEGYDVVDNEYFGKRADEAKNNEAAGRKALGLPAKYILSLGRFVKKKNLETIVAAFAHASAQGTLNGHDLVFVGGGGERRAILEEAEKRKLTVYEFNGQSTRQKDETIPPGVVRIYPFAQIAVIPAIYAYATAFVLASHFEEWGLVVNEAMACGVPVLVSRTAGCAPDLVLQNQTGYRFSPTDPDELAWWLQKVCGDQELVRRLGTNGRRLIRENYSTQIFAENARKAAAFAVNRQGPSLRGPRQREKPQLRILQTCFPDYREVVFDELANRLPEQFVLVTGDEYFTPNIEECKNYKEWHHRINNIFLVGRHFCWQRGAIREMADADIAILELNPRLISNWVILIARGLAGQPTLLWGHIWARGGMYSWTNGFRLTMMRLADGLIPYTFTQTQQIHEYLPNKPSVAAPNSVLPRALCKAAILDGVPMESVLYVGRLIAAKKPQLLLNAFIQASGSLPPRVSLVFVGAGEESENLRRLAAESGLENRISFRGHVNDPEALRRIYATAYCSVSPGYVGLAAVQSYAFGVPMLVARDENHSPEIETCLDGINSVYFKSDDVMALAGAIIETWKNREEWGARRESISRMIASTYCVEAMADGFEKAIARFSSR